MARKRVPVSAEVEAKLKKYDGLTDRLATIQAEYAGKEMPAAVGDDFTAKAKEAEALWAEIAPEYERAKTLAGLQDQGEEARNLFHAQERGRAVDPTVPGGKSNEGEVAGYLSLGEAVVRSPEFQKFAERGYPRMEAQVLQVPGFVNGLVPLSKEQRNELARIDTKAVPTIGAGVIDPQRISDLVNAAENIEPGIRSILNVSGTTSSSVEYVRRVSFTRAAAPTAHGAAKPESAREYDLQTAVVRTIAVWEPVQVQQLADWPALRNLIDTDLLFDLRRTEAEQVLYGSGSGQNFAGILNNGSVHDAVANATARIGGTPTIIDQIRVGMTDVRVSGGMPNGCLIHPYDWEAVVLTKGSDEHYLAQIFPSADGGMRVWGISMVESTAMEENAGNPTEERNFLVGDFMRGATLWVREEASVIIGLQNDDLTKNLRTVLAEMRAAFAVKRPLFFAKGLTQALST